MPTVYSTSARTAHSQSVNGAVADLLVVGLCARWCGTCQSFEPLFAGLAADYPSSEFVWIDVEDDSDLAGDIDVENFPTLAIYRGAVPVYFGTSLPQRAVVARLIENLARATPRAQDDVPDAVAALPGAIRTLPHASAVPDGDQG